MHTDIRNIAIIAHVDHGKTTLVDQMLKQGGAFRANQVVSDRVMDNNALEKEKGITILAKNTSILYKNTKLNIVDTPGHADFSGEVERILKMVNGVILLVDAFEGPMPQTRFVLQKALELNHKVIVVVNKIDRPDARPNEVVDEVLGLMMDMGVTDEQLDSPILFCSGRTGQASFDANSLEDDLTPLFETILSHIPAPACPQNGAFRLLVSALDYNEYVGRIGIGRIEQGMVKVGQEAVICNFEEIDRVFKGKISSLFSIEGLKRTPVEAAYAGDIVCFSGIEDIFIGDTVCDTEDFEPLPFVKVSEPTVEMVFSVNDGPFAGREGKYVTSRHLRDRLFSELLKDVSLKVFETDSTDAFRVLGRGEMHLSILIENMRREGYEFLVSPPKVLFKEIDGKKCEPVEQLFVDVPEEYLGAIMEKLGARKGILQQMTPQGSRLKVEFLIPSRGLFGYRNEFMTDTKGEGILGSTFYDYEEYKGAIPVRNVGSLIAFEQGTSVAYGLFNAQERGSMFIGAGVEVYEGMIVGMNPAGEDIAVNVCKKKQVSNMRSSSADEALRLVPPRKLSLDQMIEFLADDELLEVTPKSLRLRKAILSNTQRLKNANRKY